MDENAETQWATLQNGAQMSPCSGATGRMQKPFCTRSTKSQASDIPPNRFCGRHRSGAPAPPLLAGRRPNSMARPRLGPVLFFLRVGVGVGHAWGTGHPVPPSGRSSRESLRLASQCPTSRPARKRPSGAQMIGSTCRSRASRSRASDPASERARNEKIGFSPQFLCNNLARGQI